jgi:hypothetical protein
MIFVACEKRRCWSSSSMGFAVAALAALVFTYWASRLPLSQMYGDLRAE